MSADFSQAFWSHFNKSGGKVVQLKPLRFGGAKFHLNTTLHVNLREFERGLVLDGQGATITWTGGKVPMILVRGDGANVGIAMSNFYLSGEHQATGGLWVEDVASGPSSFRRISSHRAMDQSFRVARSSSVVFESCQAFSSDDAKRGDRGWVIVDCPSVSIADCGVTDHAGDGMQIDVGPDDVVDVTGVQSERNLGAGIRVMGPAAKGGGSGLRLVAIRGGFIEANHAGGIVLDGKCSGVQVSDLRLVSYGGYKGPAVLTETAWEKNIVTDNLVSYQPYNPAWHELPTFPGRINLVPG
ncbi:MAG: hypothetical protein IV100_25065 [Myxococcales bacterium]|nr:hypothetical protein [Myxococcales bacterium]